MAQIPNLDNAPLNLKSIRTECLVIDPKHPKLSGPLSLIVPTSTLKEYGIKLRLLSAERVQTECTKVVYFVRTHFDSMRFISSHVHDNASKGLQREYFLYFVPYRSVACEKHILEEEEVHNLMTIGEYPLYMVPLDEDILSFELDRTLKEWQVDGDESSLWHIAKAIHKLEFAFGLIPNLRAEGKASVHVAEILNHMLTEEPVSLSDMRMPEINTLILIDREKASIDVQSQTRSEIKDLVKELNSLPEIIRHINLSRHLSMVTSKPSFLGQLDMEHTIVEAQGCDIYGFEHMATLNNLERAGLLRKQEAKSNWVTIKRALQLVVEDTDTAKMQYSLDEKEYVVEWIWVLAVLSSFGVMSSFKMILRRPMEEILKLLPGPHYETKRGKFSSSPFDMAQGYLSSIDKLADGRCSLVLIVFVGGVTFAEISALRFLSVQDGMACGLIVGTTKIINGNSLAETFLQNSG